MFPTDYFGRPVYPLITREPSGQAPLFPKPETRQEQIRALYLEEVEAEIEHRAQLTALELRRTNLEEREHSDTQHSTFREKMLSALESELTQEGAHRRP